MKSLGSSDDKVVMSSDDHKVVMDSTDLPMHPRRAAPRPVTEGATEDDTGETRPLDLAQPAARFAVSDSQPTMSQGPAEELAARAQAQAGALSETDPLTEKSPISPGIPPREFDDYEVVREIGRGGMGRVYLALDKVLDRMVAIKFITRPSEIRRKRFLNEARVLSRFRHPNIVLAHRFGQLGGQPYLVMEYIQGKSLKDLPMPMPWQKVRDLCLPIASALARAHRHRVLHRDIKPSNVLINDDGEPMLTDFGLAKLLSGPDSLSDGDSDEFVGPTGPDPRTRSPIGHDGPAKAKARGKGRVRPDDSGSPSVTADGALVGTLYYIAPERWAGENATTRTDIYAFGVLLYELCTGQVPFRSSTPEQLGQTVVSRSAPPLASRKPDVDPQFAAIVDRCLARQPEKRYASADALWNALQALGPAPGSGVVPRGNPYRGLDAFQAEHRDLFFGRDNEIQRLIERLRTDQIVLVIGESGVGKSSLIRAGVLPRIATGGFGDSRHWRVLTLVPRVNPLLELAKALSPILGEDLDALSDELLHEPAAVSRRLREQQDALHPDEPRGLVLFIDQLEELVTLSAPEQRAVFCEAVHCLVERTPGVRLLATARVDKLTDVARLPGFDVVVEAGSFLLRPMDQSNIRQAIVGPARATGIRFESESLVDELVESTISAQGGLPLLQFALARLWEKRHKVEKRIAAEALEAIGGVEGALSEHADGVLDAMSPATREAARQVLLDLVGARGTRNRRSEAELLAGDDERLRAVARLVRARIVVVSQSDGESSYEFAHEALMTGWGTLRNWLDREGGIRAIKERLHRAAREWDELGQTRDSLWRGRRLADAARLDIDALPNPERAFLSASLRAARHRKWLWSAALAVPVALLALALGWWYSERSKVNSLVEVAVSAFDGARTHGEALMDRRAQALELFANDQNDEGETAWSEVIELMDGVDGDYKHAERAVQAAMNSDQDRDDIHRLMAEVLHARAVLARTQGRQELTEDLRKELAKFPANPAHDAYWHAEFRVTLHTSPPGLAVQLWRYDADPERALSRTQVGDDAETPARWRIRSGSYLLIVQRPDEMTGEPLEVRYPFLLTPDSPRDEHVLRLDIPTPSAVPDGFVYVPPGEFLFGMGRNEIEELGRAWVGTVPLHQRRTEGYLIAQRETTYGEWIEYLDSLSDAERKERLHPGSTVDGSMLIELDQPDNLRGKYRLTHKVHGHKTTAIQGQPIVYPGRPEGKRQSQDWSRLPVTGISALDAKRYLTWLRDTGRVPHARLCREDEWERAARGADGRKYPHGEELLLGDANFDETYGREKGAYGFDEVGSHRASESPFGLQDTVGNAREMTRSILGELEDSIAHRGGDYYRDTPSNQVAGREWTVPELRLPHVGLRVCADPVTRATPPVQ